MIRIKLKSILFSILLIGITGFVQAQKIGHIDSQELLSLMPETISAQQKLQTEAGQLEEALELMQVEYNKKLQDYYKKADSLPPLVRANREEELTDMMERVQNFQTNAETSLQEKQKQLFQPIMDKAQKAIDDVARENEFTYVFDLSSGSILYVSDTSQDLMPLVKTKLGIQ